MWLARISLLFLLIAIHTDAGRINRIVKGVGKRFSEFNQLRLSQRMKTRQWQVKRNKWDLLSEKEVEMDKFESTERIGEKFVHQQSAENLNYQVYADMLMGALDKSMTATICGGSEVLGYYKFHNHLHNQRKSWLATKERNVTYTVMPTDRDTLESAVSFRQHSRWGYTSTIVYKMKGKLDLNNDATHFVVNHIDLLGGCSETGTVDLTQMGVSLTEQEIWKKDTEAQQFFKLFTPGALEYAHQPEDKIPQLWLESLESDEKLTATTCQRDGGDGPNYTREQFWSYWERFGMLWHPKKDAISFIQKQTISMVPNEELTARITMSLQPGEEESAPVVDWDMKIQAQFNKRGDNRWYISKVEMMCPLNLNGGIQKINYNALMENFQKHFRKMIASGTQWFSALGLINRYVKGAWEMESCGKKMANYGELEKSFWNSYTGYPGTMKSYEMQPVESPGETTSLSMQVNMTGKKTDKDPYEAVWKLFLKWDKMDQVYHIYKVDFGCITQKDLPPPCYHKLCTYVD